jgi:hypothetical protein
MKKLILFLLLCGASAKSMENDSLSLLDSKAYQLGNVKKAVNWGVRAGFQAGKMYLGKQLFFRPAFWYSRVINGQGAAYSSADWLNYPRFVAYRGGGAALFLHGLKGFLKECGYESPGKFFKYVEGKK